MKWSRVFGLGLLGSLLFSQPVTWRVSTLAGNASLGNDGPATQAILGGPRHLVFDRAGVLYFADPRNHQVRRITRDGRISAVAGNGVRGYFGDGGPALAAQLNTPSSVALDGNFLYVADEGNLRIRVVNLTTGVMEAYAGTGAQRDAGDGGPAGNASFLSLNFIAADPAGNVVICDAVASRVRRVDRATGVIRTILGTGSPGRAQDDMLPTSAPISGPQSIAFDSTTGLMFVVEGGNQRVLVLGNLTPVRRYAGGGSRPAFTDGSMPMLEADFVGIHGIAVDGQRRRIYLTNPFTDVVQQIDMDLGSVETFAGALRQPGPSGNGEPARLARLRGPAGIAIDADGAMVISEAVFDNTAGESRLRRIDAAGIIGAFAGRSTYGGDGGPATNAILYEPSDAISDGEGGYLIADRGNCVIRRVNRAGVISTFLNEPSFCAPRFNAFRDTRHQISLARDRAGNVYIAAGGEIRRYSPDTGRLTPVANVYGHFTPITNYGGIALDPTERFLYAALPDWHQVRKIDLWLANRQTDFAGRFFGRSFSGDGGPAMDAGLHFPTDVAVDREGNVFIADQRNHRVRRVDAQTMTISTVAGDGSPETLPFPNAVTLDANGVLYAAAENQVMQGAGPLLRPIAGGRMGGSAGDGGPPLDARFNSIGGLRMDGANLLVADTLNHRIRLLTPVSAATMAITAGDDQQAQTSALAAMPLTVQVRAADGTPVAGVSVTFTASAGVLDPARPVVTDRNGNASARITMPPTAGAVTVIASLEGNLRVTFRLTATPKPVIASVITAGNFGAAPRLAPGSWIEIYGSNFARSTTPWSATDFDGLNAPTSLGGVRVTIGGRPAFLQLVSAGQINALAPDGLSAGAASVVVSSGDGASEPFTVQTASRAPALLAPASFASGGIAYVAATFADGVFMGPPDLILGAAFRRARPGDRLVFYGAGFGATTPPVPAGQIAGGASTLPDLAVRMGGVPAIVEYGGLAAGLVGLYQFNVVTPAGVAGDVPLEVTVAGVPVAQRLFVAME